MERARAENSEQKIHEPTSDTVDRLVARPHRFTFVYNMTSNVLRFADDTKVFRKVNNDGDKQHLHLDKLNKWFEKMANSGTGHGNLDVNNKMRDTGTTVKEKDLRVSVSADMKVSEQCGIAASKGNQSVGLIRRNTRKIIIYLYKAYLYWLERIQRRATKTISDPRDLIYEGLLK